MHRIAALAVALVFPLFAQAAVFIVNSAADIADTAQGNGVCATAGGVCTLRAAMQEANALAGTDTIQFGIGSGPQTITLATPLPVASSMLIDATTQLGTGAGPFILLDGQDSTHIGFEFATVSGITVSIQGFAIGRFTAAGIKAYLSNSTLQVKSCHIGVGLDGVTDMGNGDGIWAVVNGFSGSAMYIGEISGGGNVISGNQDMAIEIEDGPTGAKLTTFSLFRNIIGLGADGMTAVPNASGGIRTDLQFGTVTIGGSIAARNVISGNGGRGYGTTGFLQTDIFNVGYNYVGVAQDGVTARPNLGDGLVLVGRELRVNDNVIAANTGNGLLLDTAHIASPIRGNRIGVAADGSARGNGGAGILWRSGTLGVIGGAGATLQNLIAHNGGAGIRIVSGQAEIDGNSIHSNTGLGIDIGTPNVVDANDANDADSGSGNNQQNRPVLASAVRGGGLTVITGSLSSAPSSTYRLRFYASSAADPSGFGEGETFLGETSVTTSAGGTVGFTYPSTFGAPGMYVTATATTTSGDTSELSNAQLVTGPPQIRMAAASVSTPESGNVTLTIERVNGTAGAASVDWTTIPGSAGSADFIPVSGTADFGIGDTSTTIVIVITSDALDEASESFNVELSNPSSGTELGSPAHTTVHIDDDDPTPSLSIADATQDEGTGGMTSFLFDVTLSEASGRTVTVDYLTGNVDALAGEDYAASGGTLTFAPGETVKTISVPVVADAAIEGDETFTVGINNLVHANVNRGLATGRIVNDDGVPAITIDDVAVVEGDAGTSSAVFTVSLSGTSAVPVSVAWSVSAGTATPGGDVELGSASLLFPAGETEATIVVTLHGDTLIENNETFFVNLSGPSNATLADAQGSGTIADDDGTPSLSINDPAVVEGVAATFTVTLAPASTLPVTVDYATGDVTAIDGDDYTGASGTLTFAAGETSKTIDVTTLGDTVAEPAETFSMTLSSASGALLGDANGTATIIDDDGAPRVTIGNASAAEGVGLAFTIDLSHASASAVDVTWTTANGTATAGSDYTSGGATVMFAPGETTKTINVATLGDLLVEGDETLFVQLTSATNATITDAEGAGTILNDDGTTAITIADASAAEGGVLTFDVTLSSASSLPVSVSYATGGGTATAGIDYVASSGSVTFNPGVTARTITIPTIGDALAEANETFTVTLSTPVNGTLGTATATGTILDDDAPPPVPVLSIAPTSTIEGMPMMFTVTLSTATTNEVQVNYATVGDGTATGGDYTAIFATLVFAPGETAKSVAIPTAEDTLAEGNEYFIVALGSPLNATLGPAFAANGTIIDNDVVTIPAISIASATATEGAPLAFHVTLSAPTTATVTVNYATGGGSATPATDYTAADGTLTFTPGVTTQTITVPTVGDPLVEGNETLTVTLTAPSGGTLGTATATGTILDDDATPALNIAPAAATEGSPLAFDVTLTAPTTATVRVNYATVAGSAAPGADFVTASGTVTFNPGVMTQTITIGTLDDAIAEGPETFTVALSGAVNATLAASTATGTIADDDLPPAPPAISIGDVAQFEGSSGATLFAFPVTLSTSPSAPVSVSWTVADGTAFAGADYAAAGGTVVFAPGMLMQTIFIAVHGDLTLEQDETFSVQLSAPLNASLLDATAVGTIRNDDRAVPPPLVPAVRVTGVIVTEGEEAVVTLTLSSPATNGGTLRWLTRGGTATGGSDFVEESGRVTFSGKTATISVATLDDSVDETSEAFFVELFDASGVTLHDERVEVTILDDDDPAPQRAIVMAVGSLQGAAGSRFGTAVQMVNFSDARATGVLLIRPAAMSDASRDVAIDYDLAPGELRAFGDLLAEHGLEGLATLDVVAATGALPRLTVRIYDDGGDGTTGFTLPVVTPGDALSAGDTALLIAPADPIAMRFNIGVRTLAAGATLAIEVRDRTGATRHSVTRNYEAGWFNQVAAAGFAGVPLNAGDYLAITVVRGSAILYGASVDNATNDPSVQVATK
ncbi:MAG TPA: Calx-beta domain-containing protein [Thermoanaerobaculia bacterium]